MTVVETPTQIHYHKYAVSLETFQKYPKLSKEFLITQTCKSEKGGIPYVNTMEAKNYPIFTIMYHPEYKLFEFMERDTGPVTDEIAFRLT